jgi:hypothetical protein
MLENARRNSYLNLLIEKILIESKYDWLKCEIEENVLIGQGYLSSATSKRNYKVRIKYSYFHPYRFDRVWIVEPNIGYHPKTHMYYDSTLCLYYPKDLSIAKITPLATMLPWISEWVIKYEFWEKYKVWIGEEAPH